MLSALPRMQTCRTGSPIILSAIYPVSSACSPSSLRQVTVPGNLRSAQLHREISACSTCAAELPFSPRPIVQFSETSGLVIVGQAPGAKVQASGIAWDDDSGDHLRDWLNVSKETFYDPARFALMPMGFCYPGKASGGDAPPRPECAPQWHEQVLDVVPETALLVLSGQYAQRYYLGPARMKNLTETVRNFHDYLPRFFPLPHPSWRSRIWMKKNRWFAEDVLPVLREVANP